LTFLWDFEYLGFHILYGSGNLIMSTTSFILYQKYNITYANFCKTFSKSSWNIISINIKSNF